MNDSLSFYVGGVSLHSRYNPILQANRFLKSNCPSQVRTLIIVGAGFGYLAKAAHQMFPLAKTILVYSIQDEFTPLPGPHWRPGAGTVRNENDTLENFLLKNLHYSDISGLNIVYWPPGCKLLNKYCPDYLSEIKNAVTSRQMELVTMGALGRRFLSNTLRNTWSPPVSVTIPNRPIVVVAPGASLLQHIPVLRSRQHECTIITVSSALQPLLDNGIVPDFVAAIDAGFHAGTLLQPLLRFRMPHIPILAYPQANLPSWLENPRVFFGDASSLEGSLFQYSGRLALSAPSSGTVTAALLQLLRRLQVRRILFIGLDLGSRNGKTHVPGHSSIHFQLERCNRLAPFSHSEFVRSSHARSSLQQYYTWFIRNATSDGLLCYTAQGGTDAFPELSAEAYLKGSRKNSECGFLIAVSHNTVADPRPFLERLNDDALDAIDYLCAHKQLPHYPHPGTEVLIYTLLPLLNQGTQSYYRLYNKWDAVYSRLRKTLYARFSK